jgi:hypothetical protein
MKRGPPAYLRNWGPEGLIVMWGIDAVKILQKRALSVKYERRNAKCPGFAESDSRWRDSLLCLNYLADMGYFYRLQPMMMRQYTGEQLRQEDRGMNA